MSIIRASESDIQRLVQKIKGRFGNVDNKSAQQILSELTRTDIETKLGYSFEIEGEISDDD